MSGADLEDRAPGVHDVPLPASVLPTLPAPDTAPKRGAGGKPTTRAGRRAVTEANKAKRAQAADKAPKPGAKAAPRRASLEQRLTASLVSLGAMVAAGGAMAGPAVQLDGVAIVEQAPSIAAALDRVAKDDPRVAAALERMLTAGVWSGLIAALLPLVVTIAGNHGALPPQLVALLTGAPAAPVPDAT